MIGVRGRCGASIDRFQFLFVDINSGQCVETPAVGGNGGGSFEFICPPGQWIDKIRVRFDKFLQSLQFETNTGLVSAQYGGNHGKSDYLNVSGKRISGVSWRSGSLVDGVQFFYTA